MTVKEAEALVEEYREYNQSLLAERGRLSLQKRKDQEELAALKAALDGANADIAVLRAQVLSLCGQDET